MKKLILLFTIFSIGCATAQDRTVDSLTVRSGGNVQTLGTGDIQSADDITAGDNITAADDLIAGEQLIVTNNLLSTGNVMNLGQANTDFLITPEAGGDGTLAWRFATTTWEIFDNMDLNGNVNIDGTFELTTSAIRLPEISTPSTPASGSGEIYFKSDGNIYALNDAGTETNLNAAGGGTGDFLANGSVPMTAGITFGSGVNQDYNVWTIDTAGVDPAFDYDISDTAMTLGGADLEISDTYELRIDTGGADADAVVFGVNVSTNPEMTWDESEDKFDLDRAGLYAELPSHLDSTLRVDQQFRLYDSTGADILVEMQDDGNGGTIELFEAGLLRAELGAHASDGEGALEIYNSSLAEKALIKADVGIATGALPIEVRASTTAGAMLGGINADGSVQVLSDNAAATTTAGEIVFDADDAILRVGDGSASIDLAHDLDSDFSWGGGDITIGGSANAVAGNLHFSSDVAQLYTAGEGYSTILTDDNDPGLILNKEFFIVNAQQLTYDLDVDASTAGSGAPHVLSGNGDSGTVNTNEGSTAENYHTLPSATARYIFTFYCQDTDGIRITAAAGDTIRIKQDSTATGGYISTDTVGAYITLVAINSSEWVAISVSNPFWDIDGVPTGEGAYGEYYFSSAASTTLAVATPAKAAGTTTALRENGFTHSTNRLTYNGGVTRTFKIDTGFSVTKAGGGSSVGSFLLYKNGSAITGLEVNRDFAGTGSEGAISVTGTVELATNDYIELWIETDDGDDLTIESGVISILQI